MVAKSIEIHASALFQTESNLDKGNGDLRKGQSQYERSHFSLAKGLNSIFLNFLQICNK